MKKEINYLMIYFSTVLIATIIAVGVENKKDKVTPTKVTKAVYDEPDTDWTNIDNPAKKAYLERLYNASK
jgi:hypothetical protein